MSAAEPTLVEATGTFAPLRQPVFRNIWTASLLANFGQLILGVAAAWEMTRLTSSNEMVALVQSALMLPLMLVSLPAGAIADMFDRRKIAMTGLGFAMVMAAILAVIAWSGNVTPWLLLGFIALIGAGVALYSPAWQSSVSEQVPQAQLPAAVALGTISYNVARSFGPALGGALVLAFGAQAAFALNAAFYVPLFLAFLFWQRQHVPSRLPPERLDRAIVAGARYARHSPAVRSIVLRALAFGVASASLSALAPLVARDLLKGDASTYGLLLGAAGVGAVGGALLVGRIGEKFPVERAIAVCAVLTGLATIVIGLSTHLWITAPAMLLTGATNILIVALLNVSVQTSVPRWVTARAISLYSSALTGGIALGAWIWGVVVSQWDVPTAFVASGIVLALTPLLGKLLPVQQADISSTEMVPMSDEIDIGLGITMRSGPIAVEVEYVVDPDEARQFYEVMRMIQRARLRRGAFDWTLSRDISDPSLWTERYHCPTWGDYLRQRSRFTQADSDLQAQADAFHKGERGNRVRRMLERPFGSVRWRADSPDPQRDDMVFRP